MENMSIASIKGSNWHLTILSYKTTGFRFYFVLNKLYLSNYVCLYNQFASDYFLKFKKQYIFDKIQESPSEIPKLIIRTKSRRQTRQAHVSTANCPEGTIPVRLERTSSSQSNTNDTTVHEVPTYPYHITYFYTDQLKKYDIYTQIDRQLGKSIA